ncbi:MAG: hypothetical protein IJ578_04565 [Bacteroidales bacterium]|nr:hypothetical protein [Bacteroidales bacterium]
MQVLYSHVGREELAHEFLTFPSETEMMPPEAVLLEFCEVPDDAEGAKLLGNAAEKEAEQAFGEDWQPLLQVPGDETLEVARFSFYIEREALAARKFRRVEGYLSE